ncbi:hypothetical protein BDY21DRAFT_334702 [Lineolata rhizophorae]|uniref:Required for respiratory growth protein 9, mitochondrial n=1 Tax=Lineolata rhizophorae TaxID=578093 RepID=A0A6A6P8K6_9PEZI|nr:hypothetical protein BDY21DRAFT_334702 [Lineolata rhizophorae]
MRCPSCSARVLELFISSATGVRPASALSRIVPLHHSFARHPGRHQLGLCQGRFRHAAAAAAAPGLGKASRENDAENNVSYPETKVDESQGVNARRRQRPQVEKKEFSSATGGKSKPAKSSLSKPRPSTTRENPAPEAAEREHWQIDKDALRAKFGEAGWQPRKRLSPDALEGIRALHAQDPVKFSTPVLGESFEVSPEAIRRILKSKWRPSEEEMEKRRERWEKRGEKIWQGLAEKGTKPPKKWRAAGIGRAAEPGGVPPWRAWRKSERTRVRQRQLQKEYSKQGDVPFGEAVEDDDVGAEERERVSIGERIL